MRKLISVLLCVLWLAGCSVKYTSVTFNQESDNAGKSALTFSADGSKLETKTDQTADGNLDLAEAVKGAKALGAIEEVIGAIGGVSGSEDQAQVHPAGQVEEVE